MIDHLTIYYPIGHQIHQEPGHPERPERVERLRRALIDMGLWDSSLQQTPLIIGDDVLTGVHTPDYIQYLKRVCANGAHLDADTYTCRGSWELAVKTAGGAAACAQAIWEQPGLHSFALTRPPGHHATRGSGMGFCLLNNVALAAEHLIQKQGVHRIAIIDLDLHHGNGTQDIFYERGDVLYISTHQSPLYPGTGRMEETGTGDGSGTNANFPLPPGSGDIAFIELVGGAILPIMDRYKPEIVLISFGFDSHWRDPLGHLMLSAKGYAKVISAFMKWADQHCAGKLGLFLEGGYDLDAGAACCQAVAGVLTGKPWEDKLGPAPNPEGASWKRVLNQAKIIWGI